MGGGTSHSTPRTTILHNEHAVRKVYLYSLTNDIQSPGRTGFWELLRCKKNSYEKKKMPAYHGVKYLAMSSIGLKVWPVYSRLSSTIFRVGIRALLTDGDKPSTWIVNTTASRDS